MAVSLLGDSDYLSILSSYSACDVSDALVKLQRPANGEISRAGHLPDMIPYAPASPYAASCTEQPKVIGPASTLKLVAKDSNKDSLPTGDPGAIPQGHHWVDLTDDGTVVVIEQPEGQLCAAIGGIMALRMKIRSAKACVVGGRVRDLKELRSSGLPIWARANSTVGIGAESTVFGRNVDIVISGVKISPGDIIFCDPSDGVVVIPRELLNEVIALIPKLVAADDRVKEDVGRGETVAQAFREHRS